MGISRTFATNAKCSKTKTPKYKSSLSIRWKSLSVRNTSRKRFGASSHLPIVLRCQLKSLRQAIKSFLVTKSTTIVLCSSAYWWSPVAWSRLHLQTCRPHRHSWNWQQSKTSQQAMISIFASSAISNQQAYPLNLSQTTTCSSSRTLTVHHWSPKQTWPIGFWRTMPQYRRSLWTLTGSISTTVSK